MVKKLAPRWGEVPGGGEGGYHFEFLRRLLSNQISSITNVVAKAAITNNSTTRSGLKTLRSKVSPINIATNIDPNDRAASLIQSFRFTEPPFLGVPFLQISLGFLTDHLSKRVLPYTGTCLAVRTTRELRF